MTDGFLQHSAYPALVLPAQLLPQHSPKVMIFSQQSLFLFIKSKCLWDF